MSHGPKSTSKSIGRGPKTGHTPGKKQMSEEQSRATGSKAEPRRDEKLAYIKVAAYNAKSNDPILDIENSPIVGGLRCSTDITADALGQVCAETMQRAWRTGLDGTEIELRVTFS